VNDPDGAPWEIYTVLADAPVEVAPAAVAGCCGTASNEVIEQEPAAAAADRCC
jgi:hypothetical protein